MIACNCRPDCQGESQVRGIVRDYGYELLAMVVYDFESIIRFEIRLFINIYRENREGVKGLNEENEARRCTRAARYCAFFYLYVSLYLFRAD